MKLLGRILGALALLAVAVLVLAPREPLGGAEYRPLPDAPRPEDRVASVLRAEKLIRDIRPGAEKEVVWARPDKARTPLAIVYLHGFSATKEEIRPVPDDVARALGANLFFTRFTGHGRTPAAMAQATVQAWMDDVSEALAVGEAIGERTLIIATSTGVTLAALATLGEDSFGDGPVAAGAGGAEVMRNVLGMVLVSPNFGLQNPAARILTLPFARTLAPLIAGKTREGTADSEEEARWWTISYPTEALVPMAAAAEAAGSFPYPAAPPALFIISDVDKVVDPEATRAVAARWGKKGAEVFVVEPGPDDDPNGHVIAGRIMSPGLTATVTEKIIAWTRARLDEAEKAAKAPEGG